MRRFIHGFLAFLAVLAAGLLFNVMPGISYNITGTSGSLSIAGVIMSTVYLIALLCTAVWCGYNKWTSCFVAFGVILTVVGVMGMMGYMGLSYLLGRTVSVYFLCITPFAALIENTALSWNMYYAADRIMLIIPVIIYFLSLAAYIGGTILRAHEKALRYSLIKLDGRYEYRMPLEDNKENAHSA